MTVGKLDVVREIIEEQDGDEYSTDEETAAMSSAGALGGGKYSWLSRGILFFRSILSSSDPDCLVI